MCDLVPVGKILHLPGLAMIRANPKILNLISFKMNKTLKLLSLFTAISFVLACSGPNSGTGNQDGTPMTANTDTFGGGETARAHAQISSLKADTAGSGRAEFVETADNKVEMSLTLKFEKLANKSVAVHFHEHGACGDDGNEAHGHWNPTGEAHGQWNSSTFHSGDIGNIQLDAQGNGSVTLSSDRWTIGGDEKTNILGRAIIVHSGVDDYTTQPTGNSGSRIGCGVISGS